MRDVSEFSEFLEERRYLVGVEGRLGRSEGFIGFCRLVRWVCIKVAVGIRF